MSNVFTISKDFSFSASHQLNGLSEDHPCSRMHGHNYTVRLEITGKLDQTGFVVDYRALEPFKQWLDGVLDHRHLNDVFDGNPTAEHLSLALGNIAGQLLAGYPNVLGAKLSVSETPKTWATTTVDIPELSTEQAQADEEQPCTCGAAQEDTETPPAPQEDAETLAPEYEEDRYRWGTDKAEVVPDDELARVLAEMAGEQEADAGDPDGEGRAMAEAMNEAMDENPEAGLVVHSTGTNIQVHMSDGSTVPEAVQKALAQLRARHSSTDTNA